PRATPRRSHSPAHPHRARLSFMVRSFERTQPRPATETVASAGARRRYNEIHPEAPMPRTVLEPRFQVEYLSILDRDGNLDASLEPDIPGEDLKRLYRAMLLGRRLDERMIRLQRQGRPRSSPPPQ